MKFEDYVKILFNKYLWKKLNIEEYNSIFEKYSELLIKNNNEYLTLGNEFNINSFDKNDIEILKQRFNNMTIDGLIDNIFNNYLSKLLTSNGYCDKYYFKINDGDINPENIVDNDSLVFILKIKIDYNMDFNLFLKKQAELYKKCNEIENSIKEKYNIKIRILFDIMDTY